MALELFKSLTDDLNTSFKKNLFNKRNNINRRKNDFIIHTRNSVTFGSEFEMLRTTYLKNSSWKYERNNFEKKKLKSVNIVVNAVFVITETKYLIKFISTYLIQYSCIICDTLVCTPAWYDFSDIIS